MKAGYMTLFLLIAATSVVLTSIAMANPPDSTASWRLRLAADVERALVDELLEVWYPRVVDEEYGGYLTDFTYDWRMQGAQNKFIVSQARHVWTTARASQRYPKNEVYSKATRHGARYLIDRMWDAEFGGFHELLSRDGEVRPDASGSIPKRAYGNAFGIYALAGYYAATGDAEGLEAAKRAFRWLDQHSHDPVHGGYFQFMERDGTPIPEGVGNVPPKDQNSSIHLLEAFAELYRVWPDSVLGERLEEMLHIIRDTIVTDAGYMNLFFTRDWQPVLFRDSTKAVREANYEIDHVSFGHDVETAFLMLEASDALGLSVEEQTLPIGKKMVDHALDTGFDVRLGGLYDRGYYMPDEDTLTVILPTKNWWAQAEALNSLLMMAEYFPEDERDYAKLFRLQWSYVDRYLIDHEHGGWYAGGLDVEPQQKSMAKAQQWKAAYHDGRALMRVLDMLKAVH